MRVTLVKPQPDAKLGIRLAGEERPRIISLNPEGLAAKAGCLSVGDVFLKVNGYKAGNHEATTKVLRTATGRITIELYRVQLPEPGSEAAAASAEGASVAAAVSAGAPEIGKEASG